MFIRVLNKLRFLLHRDRFDRELAEELDFHREMLERGQVQRGVTREMAAVAARRQLGNTTLAREGATDPWTFTGLESVLQDLRLAVRGCRRSPAFSVAAILTLSLGIGANTAVFHVLDAVALRSLPVRDPGSLVLLQSLRGGKPASFPYPLFREMAARQEPLDGMFATVDVPGPTITVGGAEPLAGASVRLASGTTFRVLGIDARMGRLLDERDDQPSAPPVALVSHALWRSAFGGRPDTLGRQIRVNGVIATVVGVAPAAFFGEQVGASPDVWLPLTLASQLGVGWLLQPGSSVLSPMGRLRADVSRERAEALLGGLYHQLGEFDLTIKGAQRSFALEPGARGLRGVEDTLARPLWMLMGVVAFVVLLACCNLASLLLARASARRHEISVRLAIGATRRRLVRQLLTESLLLSGAGGLLGVGIGLWGSRELLRLAAANLPYRLPLDADWRTVSFAAVLSVITAGLFGLAPALKTTFGRPVMQADLLIGSGELSPRRAARAFVVAQIALSLTLVAGAALLGRSFWNLTHQDVGYRQEDVLLVRLPFDLANFTLTRDASFAGRLVARLNAVPGVRSSGLTGAGPLGSMRRAGKLALAGRPAVLGEEARFVSVSDRYLETMGIQIVAGRSITDADRPGSARVAVISQTAARRIFGSQNPLGQMFTNSDSFDAREATQIVGVTRDIRFSDAREPFGSVVFLPLEQSPAPLTSIVLRTTGDPAGFVNATQQALGEAAPGLKITDVVPLAHLLRSSLAQERMLAGLSGGFGALTLGLAAVGLYGVTAYGVAQRAREIGVRLALGASAGRVVGGILREVATLLGIGLAVGGVATFALGRLMTAFLFGLTPQDPLMLSFSAVLLGIVTMFAGWLAARRAAAVDPLRALRHG